MYECNLEKRIKGSVQSIFYRVKVYRVFYSYTAAENEHRVVHRNNRSYKEKEQKLIKTVCKVSKDHTSYHLLASGLVKDYSCKVTENYGDRYRKRHCQRESRKSCNSPVCDTDKRYLTRHGTYYYTKVKSHSGKYRYYKRKHKEQVP